MDFETKQVEPTQSIQPVRAIELPKKERFSFRRLLATIGLVLLSALAVGTSMWYVMNQRVEDAKNNTSAEVDQSQSVNLAKISELQSEVTALETASQTNPSTGEVVSEYNQFKAFCQSQSGLVNTYVKNKDGEFGTCTLADAKLISKKVNNQWSVLVSNQELSETDKTALAANKVPSYLYN